MLNLLESRSFFILFGITLWIPFQSHHLQLPIGHRDLNRSSAATAAVSPILKTKVEVDAYQLLLSRLDLTRPDLEQVRSSIAEPKEAVQLLLEYYRQRKSIQHPIATSGIMVPSDREFRMADEALDHIFVGQPAYPSYFCGESINWNTRPVPDKEWIWQLHRMYFWNAMATVYRYTHDERYAHEWCTQLVDWTDKNPHDSDHKYAWRSIEAGIRGFSWTELFISFIQSPNFTAPVLTAFLNSCFEHASYLMTTYSTGSNWALMEAEGLGFIAMTFPEFGKADSWRAESIKRLSREIEIQVYPDGHQRELAIGYHLGCIRWFQRTFELAKLNQWEDAFSPNYLQIIEKMCEVPMKIGLPDGTNVQFGDAWAGQPGQHREKYLKWSQQFNRMDFLYLATDGKKGEAPRQTAYALPSSGLYSMRSGWNKEAICLVLKCGPDGGGHCQPDNGTFDVYAGGRNLMPDAGSYIYSGDPANRAWFRQTSVHQTLTLDGLNSNYSPDLLLWKPGDVHDILVVENESYPNLTHRRAVFFVNKKYFVVVDEAYGPADGKIDIHFQLAPGDCNYHPEDLAVITDFSEGWNLLVKARSEEDLLLEKEDGQVSFEYTKKQGRPAFRYRQAKAANQGVRFVTLVVPFHESQSSIKARLLEKSEIPAQVMKIEIEENGSKTICEYTLN